MMGKEAPQGTIETLYFGGGKIHPPAKYPTPGLLWGAPPSVGFEESAVPIL